MDSPCCFKGPGLATVLEQFFTNIQPIVQSMLIAIPTQVKVNLCQPGWVLPTCDSSACTVCLTVFHRYHTDTDDRCHNCRQSRKLAEKGKNGKMDLCKGNTFKSIKWEVDEWPPL